ncbi:hypothetical protein [Acinetobacter baumannii]
MNSKCQQTLIGAILLSGCNDSANDNSNTPDTGKKPVMRCAP